MGKSWLSEIKSKKHASYGVDKRYPASQTIPGLKEFVAAVKSNPTGLLKVPVGYEVIKEHSGVDDTGEEYKEQETTIYLKQDLYGYFAFVKGEDVKDSRLEIYENNHLDTMLEDLKDIKEIKRVSATQFKVILTLVWEGSTSLCEITVSLDKAGELFDSGCKSEDGKSMSQSKVISIKPINVQNFKDDIKSIKAQAYPGALNNCDDSKCINSITDEEAQDWSFILK